VRTVLVIVAGIVVANLGFLLILAAQDLHERRKERREVRRLHDLFRSPGHPLLRATHGPKRLVGRSVVAVAAVVVLGGVAIASPTIRDAVVSGAIRAADIVAGDAHLGEGAAEETSPSSRTEGSRSPSGETRPPADSGSAESVSGGGENRGDGRGAGAEPTPPAPPGETPSPSGAAEPVPSPSPSPAPSDPTPPPDVPFTATAEPTSPTTIVVSWDRVPTATAYSVTRSILGSNDWVDVARVPAGKRSTVSGELQPGTTYLFRVTATIARGGEEVDETSATTPPDA